jgi:hypothetical protein
MKFNRASGSEDLHFWNVKESWKIYKMKSLTKDYTRELSVDAGKIFSRKYERESVNRSQLDIKRKACDTRNWKYIYIYISTCPPPTLIHLSHRFTSGSKPAAEKSFGCGLSHFRTAVSTSPSSAERSPPSCEPLYATNTSQHKQKIFLYKYALHWVLLPTKKNTTERCPSETYPSSTVAILTSKTNTTQ